MFSGKLLSFYYACSREITACEWYFSSCLRNRAVLPLTRYKWQILVYAHPYHNDMTWKRFPHYLPLFAGNAPVTDGFPFHRDGNAFINSLLLDQRSCMLHSRAVDLRRHDSHVMSLSWKYQWVHFIIGLLDIDWGGVLLVELNFTPRFWLILSLSKLSAIVFLIIVIENCIVNYHG